MGVLFCFLILISSSTFSIEFDALPFHKSHPETYSLLMVDSSRVPFSAKASWKDHKEFADIGPTFLRSTLVSDEEISFAKSSEQAKSKAKWVRKHTKKLATDKGKPHQPYFVVQLLKQNQKLRALNLIEALTPGVLEKPNEFTLQAALIIFPYQKEQAMVYGFGKWNMLLNPYCIIPQWGLRMLASSNMCNPDAVKRILATHHRTSNPSSRSEKAAKMTKIENFAIEVGSEGLDSMSALPKKSYKTSHLIAGRDYLQFTVNPETDSDQVAPAQTIKSLEQIATHFLKLTNEGLQIHGRMKEFIDEEIKEKKTIALLNTILLNLIKSKDGRLQVFIHTSLWGEQQTKTLLFGDTKARSLFDVLASASPTSSPKVKVWNNKHDTSEEVDILRFLYSLPIEHEENFYRFERGNWYAVDASRFESIKRIMRGTRLPQGSLQLPSYSFKDTERSDTKTVDYKEANYNARVVEVVNKVKGWEATLLDRLTVSIGGGGHRFEFADLLLRNNGHFYIVHVKRAKIKQLSHQREQVERSADFLATELKRSKTQDLLLKGVINGLYQLYELPSKKAPKQGARLTKGNQFQRLAKGFDQKKKTFKEKVDSTLLSVRKKDEKILSEFKQAISDQIDYEFFDDHQEELVVSLDALFDCIVFLSSKAKAKDPKEIKEIAAEFFDAVKQAIQAQKILFQDGILKKKDLNKITIVLAVIDDRNIERLLKSIRATEKSISESKAKKLDTEKKDKLKKLDQVLAQQNAQKKSLVVCQAPVNCSSF